MVYMVVVVCVHMCTPLNIIFVGHQIWGLTCAEHTLHCQATPPAPDAIVRI